MFRKVLAEVIKVEKQVDGVFTVWLRTEKPVRYLPGQFLHLSIDSNYDGVGQWPDSRCFSMQSNPGEDEIRITYAVKGKYTKLMSEVLKPGFKLWIKLPYGELFTQVHNKENTVFIAGGTGVTPFLSLFTDPSFNLYINPRVFLGFRSASYNFYERDLSLVTNPNATFTILYQDIDGSLNIEKILKLNGVKSTYFISGPPEMIRSFKTYLLLNGVPDGQVCTDDWE